MTNLLKLYLEARKLPAFTVTRRGDVWTLRKHRRAIGTTSDPKFGKALEELVTLLEHAGAAARDAAQHTAKRRADGSGAQKMRAVRKAR